MHTLIAACVCVVGLHCVGFGLSGAFYRNSTEKAAGLAPLFGLAYLMLCSWWAYSVGFSLGGGMSLAIVLPAVVWSVWVFLTAWTRRQQRVLLHRGCIFGAIWLVAVEILLLPLLSRGDALIVTLGNNDIAHHSAISRFLMEQGRLRLSGFPAQYPHAFVWFSDNTFFGYYSFVANAASLSGRLPHEIVSAVQACVAALIASPVYLLLRRTLGVSRIWAMLWAILAVAQALALFVLYHGFGGQIFGVCFGFALIFLLVNGPPERTRSSIKGLKHPLAIALLLAGMILSYPHMLPFVLFVAFIWRIMECWQRGLMASIPAWAMNGIVAGLVCCSLIPNRLVGMYLWLKEAASGDSGWPAKFLWPDYLLGLIGSRMDQAHVALAPPTFRLGVGLVLAVLVGLTCFPKWKFAQLRLLRPLVTLAAIYACALFFAFTKSGEIFGDYKSFKLLTFFSPLVVIAVGACWVRFWHSSHVGRAAAGMLLAGYLYLWGLGIIAMVRGDGRGNILDTASVNAFATMPRNEFKSVNVVTPDHWASMWVVYFFLEKQIYQAFRTYYPSTPLNGQVSFVTRNTKFVSLLDSGGQPTGLGLSFYPNANFLSCFLELGWHGPESNHVWMGANGTDAEIAVFAPASTPEINARIHLQPFLPNNAYSVFWNDAPVADNLSADVLALKLTSVKPGKNILRLRSKLPPQPPGGGDFRPICFGLRNLELDISR